MMAPLPSAAKAQALQELVDVFAGTFEVEAPRVAELPFDEGLALFREFSAVCMEAALADEAYAAAKRDELEVRARALGAKARAALKPRDKDLAKLVSFAYDIIGIKVTGSIPGQLVFHRCYFSARYTPELCAFMSAFDSGMVGGFCGGGALEFSTRITEGCDACRARFVR